MNKNQIYILLLGIVLMAFIPLHDFYLSTTIFKWVPEKNEIQLTSRFFIDDMEALMQKTHPKIAFAPDSRSDEIDRFIEHFFVTNVKLALDKEPQSINYLGREYQEDLLVVYAHVEGVSSEWSSLQIKNTFLLDLLETQQNIVHVQTPFKKKSFLLSKDRKEFEFIQDFD